MVTGRVLLAELAVLGFAAPDGADAQSFPEKLIKIVVPYPPGGPSDVAARLVVQPLSAHLGQPVIVENLAGAGGRLGAKAAAGASADGYTLLLGGTNPNAIAPSIYTKLNFEPIKAFTAVGVIGVDSNALVVHPDVPVKTIHELIAYSKANPGSLSSGATVGIGAHVCLELIRSRSGSSMNFIPSKGISQALHGRRRGARSGSRSPAGRCQATCGAACRAFGERSKLPWRQTMAARCAAALRADPKSS
jgi:tripartite-type tricarboxylate transporter receptor subunit TctC